MKEVPLACFVFFLRFFVNPLLPQDSSVWYDGMVINRQAIVMILNEGQAEFKAEFDNWYDSGDPFYRRICLKGAAGTGKTSALIECLSGLSERREKLKIALTAPTHRATAVLAGMAAKCRFDVEPHICTLHSLLHLQVHRTGMNSSKLEVKRRRGSPHYNDFDLVIVDESSMIDSDLAQHIPEWTRTVVMGDPYQLPPIEGDGSMPLFDMPRSYELQEVMRYDGDLAAYADAVRIEQKILNPLDYCGTGGGNLRLYSTREEWQSALKESVAGYPIGAVKAIAYDNRTCDELNNVVRLHLSGKLSDAFNVGDMTIANESIPEVSIAGSSLRWDDLIEEDFSGKSALLNSQPGRIESVQKKTLNVHGCELSVQGFLLGIKTALSENEIFVADRESYSLILSYSKTLASQASGKSGRELGMAWKRYHSFLSALGVVIKGRSGYERVFPRLAPDFASTIHKCQGSSIPITFLDMRGIARSPEEIRVPLLYTALTRAKTECHVLLPSEFAVGQFSDSMAVGW